MSLKFPKIKRPFPVEDDSVVEELSMKSATVETSPLIAANEELPSSLTLDHDHDTVEMSIDSDSGVDFKCHTSGNSNNRAIQCDLCLKVLQSEAEYERHYRAIHSHMCVSCRATFPSSHMLEMHITEQHDVFFQLAVERGVPMFRCLLDPCPVGPFSTKEDRRRHMIVDHCYPHDYPEYFRIEQDSNKAVE